MISFPCPDCSGAIQHDSSLAGCTVACPHCGGSLLMPPAACSLDADIGIDPQAGVLDRAAGVLIRAAGVLARHLRRRSRILKRVLDVGLWPAISMCAVLLAVLLAVWLIGLVIVEDERPPMSEPLPAAVPIISSRSPADPLAINERLQLGKSIITPISIDFRKVTDEFHFFSRGQTEHPVLVLTWRVKNVSEGQVFSPDWFCLFDGGIDVIDNFGNRLQVFDCLAEGSQHEEDLQPGEEAIIIVAAIPKNLSAKWYHWTIGQRTSNAGSSQWTFECGPVDEL